MWNAAGLTTLPREPRDETIDAMAKAACAVEFERERMGPLTDERWQEMLWQWRNSDYPSDHSRVDRLMQQARAAYRAAVEGGE